jgi:hypothetical protein
MTSHGARTGRKTALGLANTAWLLILAGFSCNYKVTLPWVPVDASMPGVPVDASTPAPDASMDQMPSASSDTPIFSPDGPQCRESTRQFSTQRILVAIDRSLSMSMPKSFDSTSKMQAAWYAFYEVANAHPKIAFSSSCFPGTTCGGTCCPDGWTNWESGHFVKSENACGLSDGGFGTSSDSPSAQLLEQSVAGAAKFATLVLITDQNPSCAGNTNDAGSLCDMAVAHAITLGKQQVRTLVVVPIADGKPIPDCLSSIAQKNAASFSDAQQIWSAQNRQSLRSRLENIASDVEKNICRFKPDQKPDQVTIAGVTIPRDETGQTGWDFVDGQIVLSSEACTRAINTNSDVKAVCNPSPGKGQNGP